MSESTADTTLSTSTSLTEMVDALITFEGPADRFLTELLAMQCRVSGASSGAIFGLAKNKSNAVVVHPALEDPSSPPDWLTRCLEEMPRILRHRETMVLSLSTTDGLYKEKPDRCVIAMPVQGHRGIAGFLIETSDTNVIAQAKQNLELTATLASLYDMRLLLQSHQADLRRVGMTVEVMSSLNEHHRAGAAMMALCNDLTARFSAARVSVGLLRGRYIKLRAMSHTEKFTRKMQLVQQLEAAMEECLDQDVEVMFPADREATYIHRATGELSTHAGPSSICSLPLRLEGKPVGVVTLERSPDQPFEPHEIEILRVLCDLCTRRLYELNETDRWFGARLATTLQRGFAAFVGPEHTWAKLTAVGLLAAILFFCFAKGDYLVEAPFEIKATARRIVPAPYNGHLVAVEVEPNDQVIANQTILAKLDAVELRLEAAAAKAEIAIYFNEADLALREGNTAEQKIALANADRVRARLSLLDYRIDQAVIRAPVSGVVLKGDLKQDIGMPVEAGEILFEVAPIDALHAELLVDESRIPDIKRGDRGELASASAPGVYLPFEIDRINPIAEVVEQRNVFRVRVKLIEAQPNLRPGMQGIAKVDLGQKHYAWLWSRELVDWLRMKLWF